MIYETKKYLIPSFSFVFLLSFTGVGRKAPFTILEEAKNILRYPLDNIYFFYSILH